MMDSRDLLTLHPVVRTRFLAVRTEYYNATGYQLLVTSTRRDEEMQAFLYAQGRTRPGKIVTNAKPGESSHELGIAVDNYPMIGGKIVWISDGDKDGKIDQCWLIYGEIATKHGFSWAGNWKGKLVELPHIQFTGGYTVRDLFNNKSLMDNFK